MSEQDTAKDSQMATLRQVVVDSCIEMLGATGCPARVVEARPTSLAETRDLAGFIGFAGMIRGSLTIAGSADLFRLTYPAKATGQGPTQVDLFDWTSEMANQILGRVKRRLCEKGIDFDASLPMAIEGRELWWRYPGRARALDFFVAVKEEVLTVHFEIVSPGSGTIFADGVEPISHSLEGDSLIF